MANKSNRSNQPPPPTGPKPKPATGQPLASKQSVEQSTTTPKVRRSVSEESSNISSRQDVSTEDTKRMEHPSQELVEICNDKDLISCLNSICEAIIHFIDQKLWELTLKFHQTTEEISDVFEVDKARALSTKTHQLAAFKHLLDKEINTQYTEADQLKSYIESLNIFLAEAKRKEVLSNLNKELQVNVVKALLMQKTFDTLAHDNEALEFLKKSLKKLAESPGMVGNEKLVDINTRCEEIDAKIKENQDYSVVHLRPEKRIP